MIISLKESALELGIVTHNGEEMLRFYHDILGLPIVGEITFPNFSVLNKLQCGTNLIKILVLNSEAEFENIRGGYARATGYRYCTLNINNLDETLAHCQAKDVDVVFDAMELRAGVRVAMIEDPDGNTIELFEERN
jgi:catechol 2,3-dioxygenase-like lactoylglutathione lyase family enzyme